MICIEALSDSVNQLGQNNGQEGIISPHTTRLGTPINETFPPEYRKRIEIQRCRQGQPTGGHGSGVRVNCEEVQVIGMVVICPRRSDGAGRASNRKRLPNIVGLSNSKNAVRCLLLLIFGTFALPYFNIC